MKKILLALLLLPISVLSLVPPTIWATNGGGAEYPPLGKITLPPWLTWTKAHPGVSGINLLVNNAVRLIFILASVGLFFMFLWGGVNFIFSQGDKARTEAARNIITYALVGFTIVALSFAIMKVIETFFGISIISQPPTDIDNNPCPPNGFELENPVTCLKDCEREGIGYCDGAWCCPD